MPRRTILFVSHSETRCGVNQFGRNVGDALRESKHFRFLYREPRDHVELGAEVHRTMPAAVIYNYHPGTLPWITPPLTSRFLFPQIGIVHEVTQALSDGLDGSLFDYHIAPDPTLILRNPIVYKTGRLIPQYQPRLSSPETPTIGCFGFATSGKGFERLVECVQTEYDHAIIRFHIPHSAFADADGNKAKAIAEACRQRVFKPGIELRFTHDFLDQEQLLDFLASNTLNAFFYEEIAGRGISSVIDYALAVRRPLAITRSNMFRHLFEAQPSIFIGESSLRDIVAQGLAPLLRYQSEWTKQNIIWDYERIAESVLSRSNTALSRHRSFRRLLSRIRKRSVKVLSARSDRKMGLEIPASPLPMLAKGEKSYSFPLVKEPIYYNRILDDAARVQYDPVVEELFRLNSEAMARKIARANVQQAFVLDTVLRFAAKYAAPKILCVGGYEDTAAGTLRMIGIEFENIDPALNYDLATFLAKPSTVVASYQIVFATSVLEHVYDDVAFVQDLATLLRPGGFGVLTCDFNDAFRQGQHIPAEDLRLYTQRDIRERILPAIPDCLLVDEPRWDCPSPDFEYANCRYTFATIVFRKVG